MPPSTLCAAESICGAYYDPKHGGCMRIIYAVDDGIYAVHGAYGDDEDGSPATSFLLTMKHVPFPHIETRGIMLSVDFGHKSVDHAKRYVAVFRPDKRRIEWQDGNAWQKMYANASQFASAFKNTRLVV